MTVNYENAMDEALLADIAEGNRHAFSTLVNRHANRFFQVAYRVVQNREDAEDIVQDAFVALWQNPSMWDSGKGAKFTTWFFRVITNRALNVKKMKHPQTPEEMPEIADDYPIQDEQLIERGQRQWMESQIKNLPNSQQLALNLCFFEGLSNQEAAAIMGVRLKALQSLLMRAKTSLRQNAEREREKQLNNEQKWRQYG